MTLDEIRDGYGREWEIFPHLAIGVAASRWHFADAALIERGWRNQEIAGDLAGLAAKLEDQRLVVRGTRARDGAA